MRLIFTDLDGSLLDHNTYSFDPAAELLLQLEQQQIPVIPVTSKTRAEVMALRQTCTMSIHLLLKMAPPSVSLVGISANAQRALRRSTSTG